MLGTIWDGDVHRVLNVFEACCPVAPLLIRHPLVKSPDRIRKGCEALSQNTKVTIKTNRLSRRVALLNQPLRLRMLWGALHKLQPWPQLAFRASFTTSATNSFPLTLCRIAGSPNIIKISIRCAPNVHKVHAVVQKTDLPAQRLARNPQWRPEPFSCSCRTLNKAARKDK